MANLTLWLKWSWRDLRARWLQVVAIALIDISIGRVGIKELRPSGREPLSFFIGRQKPAKVQDAFNVDRASLAAR